MFVVLAVICSAWARPQPRPDEADALSEIAASAFRDITKTLSDGVRNMANGDVATRSLQGDQRWFYPRPDATGTGTRPSYTYDNVFPDQIIFQQPPTLNGEILNPNYYAYQRQNLKPSSSTFDDISRALNDGVQNANFPRSSIAARSGIAVRSKSATTYSESVVARSGDSVSASGMTVSQSE